jgi:hypothetical protein
VFGSTLIVGVVVGALLGSALWGIPLSFFGLVDTGLVFVASIVAAQHSAL